MVSVGATVIAGTMIEPVTWGRRPASRPARIAVPVNLACGVAMILGLAEKAGLSADQLYFNIEQVGNTSSASIPLAIHDAVRDGVITAPMRIFAPGFCSSH